jgi:biopolymer transport protein ExbB
MVSFHVMDAGGPVMWLILAISLFAGILFVRRVLHLHRAQIKTTDFIRGIFTIVSKGNIVEAVSQCEETPGPVAQMIRMAILEREHGPERVRQAVQDVGLSEVPRLEANLGVLLTLAQVAPLAGLLGTVLGMLQSLQVMMALSPQVYAGDLSGGLWTALLTTAFGLASGISIYVGYNFLVSRVEAILLDMERAFGEIMLLLPRTGEGQSPTR